jgi:hypothetical protein
MYEHCFLRLNRDTRNLLEEDHSSLVGFTGEVAKRIGKLTLPFIISDCGRFRTIPLTFSVVRAQSKYNAIRGRPGIRALRALTSAAHGAMKFPTPEGVATVRSSMEIIASVSMEEGDPGRPKEKIEEWILNDKFPEQTIKIGAQLPEKWKTALKELLMRNVGVFAWQHSNMQGIPRSKVEHHLNTYKWLEPVKQKKRSIGPERSRAACEERRKILKVGIVWEVRYPTWISNPVMVKKSPTTVGECVSISRT